MQPPYQKAGTLVERPGGFGILQAFFCHRRVPGRARCAGRLHEFDAVYGTKFAIFKYEVYFAISWRAWPAGDQERRSTMPFSTTSVSTTFDLLLRGGCVIVPAA